MPSDPPNSLAYRDPATPEPGPWPPFSFRLTYALTALILFLFAAGIFSLSDTVARAIRATFLPGRAASLFALAAYLGGAIFHLPLIFVACLCIRQVLRPNLSNWLLPFFHHLDPYNPKDDG